MFRRATDNDITELRALWRKCFDADRSFLNLFFNKGYGLTRTYIIEAGQSIVSALSVFPVKFNGHNGGYVYGVCTHPEHRGHGYAVTLLRYAEDLLLDKELDFMILRPASPTLFDYYRKQGYDMPLYRKRKTIKLPLIPAEVTLLPLSNRLMYTARSRQCSSGHLFEWTPEVCGYIADYVMYCNGKACRIQGNGSYIICYPDTENNGNIICEETDCPDMAPYWIKCLYPEACTATFSLPSSDKDEEYMLCKTKSDLFCRHSPLFTFTME
ncbi:MAG TPA: GNAT family N-acetyltransferase [Candidatus Coprenecus pullistercoris]|nr:GNAT family N-acetyltransferase [Candidatus Coprenecus pullistercoris]